MQANGALQGGRTIPRRGRLQGGDRCGVEVVAWDGRQFTASERREYRRDPTGWQLPAATVRPGAAAATGAA